MTSPDRAGKSFESRHLSLPVKEGRILLGKNGKEGESAKLGKGKRDRDSDQRTNMKRGREEGGKILKER